MLNALRTYLLQDATVSALISTRMHPVELPQAGTMPALVYNVISEVRQPTMDGGDTLPAVRVQIDAYALTFAEVEEIDAAVKDRLDGASGTMSGIVVRGIFADTRRTFYESDPKLHRIQRDFIVWANEPAESP